MFIKIPYEKASLYMKKINIYVNKRSPTIIDLYKNMYSFIPPVKNAFYKGKKMNMHGIKGY